MDRGTDVFTAWFVPKTSDLSKLRTVPHSDELLLLFSNKIVCY